MTRRLLSAILAAFCLIQGTRAGTETAPSPPLRLELNVAPARLILPPIPEPGALFFYRAADLDSLMTNPEMVRGTNAPWLGDGWIPLPMDTASNAFFFAAYWPGRSVDQFGDPEHVGAGVSPSLVAFTPCDPCRQAARDPDVSWGSPLPTETSWRVSGIYGEWRGTGNADIHEGLDLAAPASTAVLASRGGVVSCLGVLPAQGAFLVLDHGDGWFSRYLHLDASALEIIPGQAVVRGAILAAGLHAPAGWAVHLHFEARHGPDAPQWMAPAPGDSVDPLLLPMGWAVPPSRQPPELVESGLTRRHPGAVVFRKNAPEATASPGPVFLLARWVDHEIAADGGSRLGLRALGFLAEGLAQPLEIRPADSEAIARLRLPGAGARQGLARYGPLHAAHADPLNWYPFWWEWDTSAYATNPAGPRSVVLTAQNYDGTSATNTLVFGPEFKDKVWEPLGSRRFRLTVIAHLGSTNTGSTQPDQYQLEVLRPDHSPMPGIQWEDTEPGNRTRIFLTHLDQAAYCFQVPPAEDPSRMVVRVSSLLAPDLRHEIAQGVVYLAGRLPQAPRLVDIPAGGFLMGSPPAEPQRAAWEGPQTLVTLSTAFKMGQYEITQAEYKALMSTNPSYFSGVTNRPVEQVSWSEARAYCQELTRRERQAGYLPSGWAYRLPAEAEWEYACRAGTVTPFACGSALRSGMANFDGRYEYAAPEGAVRNPAGIAAGKTTPVGAYAPNPWGLYDMHGNTWEWCLDGWSYFLPGGTASDPQVAGLDGDRVLRGGCWYNEARYCRSAYRLPCDAEYRGHDVGFRVVLAPENRPP